MHVLIVAYHFPPDAAVGALRPARIAEAFRCCGHTVTVITARLPGEIQDTRPAPPGMQVVVVTPARNPRQFYLAAKQAVMRLRLQRSAAAQEAKLAGAAARGAEGAGPLWKRFVLSLLWLPDDQQGFIPVAIASARRVHREAPVHLLLTTAPPFSTHLVGLLAHRSVRAPWVADFRDPWTGNPAKGSDRRTGFTDSVEHWMERRVLQRADLVVSASEGIQRSLMRHGSEAARHVIMRNGIDRVLERPDRPRGTPFRILHMGTFYLNRDPRPFLEAVAAVRDRLALGPAELRIDFLGSSRSYNGASIPSMVSALGLDRFVTFVDAVPRADAIRRASEADLLLLLAQGQPDQIPQKLYEYLATRVPILAIADVQGETADMLRRIGGHEVVDANDAGAIASALTRAIQAPSTEATGDPALLEEWTSDRQLRILLSAVDTIV